MLYLPVYMTSQFLHIGVFGISQKAHLDTAAFSGSCNSGEENEERGMLAKTAGP